MANWLSIKKIDSHVHILPKEVLDANPDSNDEFSHAKEADLIRIMDRYRGFQWKDAVKLNAYFDISAILPDYILKYGIEKCNQILRNFPVDRLFFATDWPCSRSCRTEEIYERYFDILDQMDFTETEAEQIAFGNIATLLWKTEQ